MKNLDDNKLIFENYVKSRKSFLKEMALEPTGQQLEPEDLGTGQQLEPEDLGDEAPTGASPTAGGSVEQLISQLRQLKAKSGPEAVKAELEKIKATQPEKVREIARILIAQASSKV